MDNKSLLVNLKLVLMGHFLSKKNGRDLTDLDYKDAEDFARELIPSLIQCFVAYAKEIEK